MHSKHRDVCTKFERVKVDYEKAKDDKIDLEGSLENKIEEITQLKTKNTEQECIIAKQAERIESLVREVKIKSEQLADNERRNGQILDECDLLKYKIQESQKLETEMKLKADVLSSTNEGLMKEKEHLTNELKETRTLMKGYEKKVGELILELNQTNCDFQAAKKSMISHEELQKERQLRIDQLRKEYDELKNKYETLDIAHQTLQIENKKVIEQLETASSDLQDTVEKLHITNKARHENEVKLAEEIEKSRGFQEMVKLKDESIQKKAQEVEDLDK